MWGWCDDVMMRLFNFVPFDFVSGANLPCTFQFPLIFTTKTDFFTPDPKGWKISY